MWSKFHSEIKARQRTQETKRKSISQFVWVHLILGACLTRHAISKLARQLDIKQLVDARKPTDVKNLANALSWPHAHVGRFI